MTIILSIEISHLVGIKEISRHAFAQSTCNGTATSWTIVHVNTDTCMINQLCDSLNLFLRRISSNSKRHILPIIGGSTEIDSQWTIFWMVFRNIGVASLTMGRMIPITHQLTSRCCHATSIAMASRTIGSCRTEIIIRIVLIPLCLNKILIFSTSMTRDQSASFLKHRPIGSN